MEGAVHEGLFAPCENGSLEPSVRDTVGTCAHVRRGSASRKVVLPGGAVVRCFRGGYGRGTVVTKCSPKTAQNLFQTPSYLRD